MKKVVFYGMFFSILIGFSSCISSDSEQYVPKPENGDFVAVDRMIVKDVVNGLTDTLRVNYNRMLQPVSISMSESIRTGGQVKSREFKFKYSDKRVLNSIEIKQQGVDVVEWRASYSSDGLIGFKNDDHVITYEYGANGRVIKSKDESLEYDYSYNNIGDLLDVKGQGSNLAITYLKTSNPFLNVRFNFFYFYDSGLKYISLIQGAKFNMESITNLANGEVLDFKYEYDEFGYVKDMQVLRNSIVVYEVAFKTSIYRVLE